MNGKTHLSFGIATGAATALALSPILTVEQQITLISGTAVGAVLVDIDNNESMLGRDLKPFSTIIQKIFGHRYLIHSPFFIALLYFSLNFFLKYTENNIVSRNQIVTGIVTLCCLLITFWNIIGSRKRNKFKLFFKCCLLYYSIPMAILELSLPHLHILLYGLIFGMTGHIILDLMTKGGIRILYPIPTPKKKKNITEHTTKKYDWKIRKLSLLPMKTGKWYEVFVAMFIFGIFLIALEIIGTKFLGNNYMPLLSFINIPKGG